MSPWLNFTAFSGCIFSDNFEFRENTLCFRGQTFCSGNLETWKLVGKKSLRKKKIDISATDTHWIYVLIILVSKTNFV